MLLRDILLQVWQSEDEYENIITNMAEHSENI